MPERRVPQDRATDGVADPHYSSGSATADEGLDLHRIQTITRRCRGRMSAIGMPDDIALGPKGGSEAAASGLPRPIAIFPVIRHPGIAQQRANQLGEAGLGAHVVREDQHAFATPLEADDGVGGLLVVSALEEAGALRAVEDDHAQSRVQILALLRGRQLGREIGELVRAADVELGLHHLGI